MSKIEIFNEISVGRFTKEQLIQQLEAAGVQFNSYASTLFEHSDFSPGDRVERLKLVKVSLKDLGLKNPCSFDTIVSRATNLELKLCPLYLGAYLRLEYLAQPAGPYLTIASMRPELDENYPTGFYIRNWENSLWLRGYRAIGESEWPDENEFIFLKGAQFD